MATINAELFTAIYILQEKATQINRFDPDPSLRNAEIKDIPYFLIMCRTLTAIYNVFFGGSSIIW